MAWRESSVVEERLRFVVLANRKQRNMTELCREFQISRQTGYVWLKRYEAGGARQVLDRSRRPLHSPQRTSSEIEEKIVELRQQWPDWGAPKLRMLLRQQRPEWADISVRTVHRILERHGLILEADRHRPADKRFERSAPNELWQMDFKGPQGFNTKNPVGRCRFWTITAGTWSRSSIWAARAWRECAARWSRRLKRWVCPRPCWSIMACRGGITRARGG